MVRRGGDALVRGRWIFLAGGRGGFPCEVFGGAGGIADGESMSSNRKAVGTVMDFGARGWAESVTGLRRVDECVLYVNGCENFVGAGSLTLGEAISL